MRDRSAFYVWLLAASERKTWTCSAPIDNPIAMGIIYYLLIVAAIVLSSSVQYRFFYGNF